MNGGTNLIDDGREEERKRIEWHINSRIDDHWNQRIEQKSSKSSTTWLTSDPSFPVQQTRNDVLHLEILSSSTWLVIILQPANDECPFFLRQEFRGIWKVLDDVERQCSRNDRNEPFDNYHVFWVSMKPARFTDDYVLKIHAQAGFPPTPSMFEIAAFWKSQVLHMEYGSSWSLTASKPPNAPETVAAEKKSAARSPNSERLYQLKPCEGNFNAMRSRRLPRQIVIHSGEQTSLEHAQKPSHTYIGVFFCD